MKISFRSYANKTTFHTKCFALSLAFKMRFKTTQKWPIDSSDQSISSTDKSTEEHLVISNLLVNGLTDQEKSNTGKTSKPCCPFLQSVPKGTTSDKKIQNGGSKEM